jgi:membrane protein implicated in regulation of membrane protease activity
MIGNILFRKEGDILLTIYLICFWVGLILTLAISLFGGHGGSHSFHVEVDMDGPANHVQGHGHSVFNLSTILAFLTGFGGTGYLLLKTKGYSGLLILLIAIVVGFLIALALFIFLSKVLLRDENVMKEADYQIAGTLGTITVSAASNGIGEMKYILEGTTRSLGVKQQNGEPLLKGTKVVVLSVDKGIAIVTAFENSDFQKRFTDEGV